MLTYISVSDTFSGLIIVGRAVTRLCICFAPGQLSMRLSPQHYIEDKREIII